MTTRTRRGKIWASFGLLILVATGFGAGYWIARGEYAGATAMIAFAALTAFELAGEW